MNKQQLFYYNRLKTKVELMGWTLVSTNYVDCKSPMIFICNTSHIINKSSDYIMRGLGCADCKGVSESIIENNFSSLVIERGYFLASDYTNGHTDVLLICINDHLWYVTPHNFKAGQNCSSCPRRSSIEAEQRFLQMLECNGYISLEKYTTNDTCTLGKMSCKSYS